MGGGWTEAAGGLKLISKATGGRLADFFGQYCECTSNTELSSILVTKDTGMIYFQYEHRELPRHPRCRRDQKYVPMLIALVITWPCGDRLLILSAGGKLRRYLEARYCKGN